MWDRSLRCNGQRAVVLSQERQTAKRVSSRKNNPTRRVNRTVPPPPPPPPPPPRTWTTRKQVDCSGSSDGRVVLHAVRGGNVLLKNEQANSRELFLSGCFTIACAVATSRKLDEELAVSDGSVVNIERASLDKVFVQSINGPWFETRTSRKSPRVILLQDERGIVYKLPIIDRSQVDLLDDDEIHDIFDDGKWENYLQEIGEMDKGEFERFDG